MREFLEIDYFVPYAFILSLQQNQRLMPYYNLRRYGEEVASQIGAVVLVDKYSTFDFLDRNSDYFIGRGDCIELKENISIQDLREKFKFCYCLTVKLVIALKSQKAIDVLFE